MSKGQTVRTRIAPSPTGEDLHIGSVYMALFNYIYAKQHKGQFIIRIEDTDRDRFVTGAEKRMLDSLNWVGIKHDEGTDIGGKYAPYRQSERLSLYQKYADELVEKGYAYYCFCTPDRLAKLRTGQQQKKQPPMYDGFCKRLSLADARKRAESEKYVIRLNVPDSGITQMHDLIRGDVKFENKLIDDQVLIKSDGFPTYHLAVVVDDYLMQITHIIRGEEWLSSVPKHVLLYRMFDWPLPQFAHLPLLRNPDKSKLSKRKNPVWLSWFKKEGFLPEAILNYLATLTWSMPDGRDIFSLKEMLVNFSIDQIKTTAPIFDLTKLSWMNGEYIRQMKDQQLTEKLISYLPKDIDKKLIAKLAPLARERMKKLNEFAHYLIPFTSYRKANLTSEEVDIIRLFYSSMVKIGKWQAVNLHEQLNKEIEDNKLKLRDALMVLRIALTGEKIGLPLFETMEILGKNEVIKRLKAVI